MILKIHKIPDKIIFRTIFALLILWNLKYFFLIFQIPFTLMFVDYIKNNAFYSQISDIRNSIKDIKDFYDEGKTGFVSDMPQASVFDIEDSIRDFYLTQYAVVPAIVKNDTDEVYVVGYFTNEKDANSVKSHKVLKKINNRTYLYKKIKAEK